MVDGGELDCSRILAVLRKGGRFFFENLMKTVESEYCPCTQNFDT